MGMFGKKKENEPVVPPVGSVKAQVIEETATPGTPTSRGASPTAADGRTQGRTTRHPATGSPTSTLNSHLVFEGDVKYQGTLVIDCDLRGKVTTDDSLVIGPSARVQAEIAAGTVEVCGKVHGNIHAKQSVKIVSGAEVYGNIESPTICMEEGVVFEGACTRPQAKAQQPQVQQPRTQAAPVRPASMRLNPQPSTVVPVATGQPAATPKPDPVQTQSQS